MRKIFASLMAVLTMVLAVNAPTPVEAKEGQLVRDAEIEDIIRAYATPLFQAAGLSPNDINVYLIRDSRLNAFVTPGLRMFINTGLLMRAETPLQVIGVIAHETGHLAAGHTATRGDSLSQATATVLASYVLGLGAALATGRPEIASAVLSGGQDIALKGLLSYTRNQESAADQAAVRLLKGTHQSPRGLLEFMEILGGQEVLYSSNQDPYLRTHPLTQDRITFLEDQVTHSPYADTPASPELIAMHNRMRAKLYGFIEPLDRVEQKYPPSDDSVPARYARAIAHYQGGDIKQALELTDALIREFPDDPYFHELKGQMQFEYGRLAEALPEYQEAVRLRPRSAQLRLGLAQVQIESNRPDLNDAALDHIEATLREEPDNSFAWRLAAVAYGRKGDVGMTALALAERALAQGQAKEARDQAVRARDILPTGSPGALRAADIEGLADRLIKKN